MADNEKYSILDLVGYGNKKNVDYLTEKIVQQGTEGDTTKVPEILADTIDPSEGFTGYSNLGSSQWYYFSNTLPKDHPGATALTQFDQDLLNSASSLKYHPDRRTKEGIMTIENELINRGYLDKDHTPKGKWTKKVSAVVNRYTRNMDKNPEKSVVSWLKSIF